MSFHYIELQDPKKYFYKGDVKAEQGEILFDAVIEVKSMKSKKVTRIDVNQESGQYVGVVNIQEG